MHLYVNGRDDDISFCGDSFLVNILWTATLCFISLNNNSSYTYIEAKAAMLFMNVGFLFIALVCFLRAALVSEPSYSLLEVLCYSPL